MEEKDIQMEQTAEETKQTAWEVVADPVGADAAEEVLEDMEEEIKCGICAAKDWLSSTLYEAGRVIREHKKAVLAIVGTVAALAAMAGALWALLKKK